MSLSSILREPATTAFLKPYIRSPKMAHRPPVQVERRSNPSRMGTAIDYALRFGLEVRGGYRPQTHIVAESALDLIEHERAFAAHRERARDELYGALYDLGDLHATTDLPESVARACLRLAALDTVFRAHHFEELHTSPEPDAIHELQALYELVPWEALRPEHHGVLNPGFGWGSHLVGGADADVFVDGCLIELKTVSEIRPSLDHVRQLVGYALLANRHGISGAPGVPVDTLGLYFTRAGHLFTFPLDACVAPEHHDLIVDYLTGIEQRPAA